MVKVAFTQLLNHLQAQNTWASPLMMPFAGKSIAFQVSAFRHQLQVLEDGRFAIAGKTLSPDVVVTLMPSTLLRLMAKDASAKSQIKIDGDTHFASVVAKVLNNMRWDYTDDLSRLVGDIPAENITQFANTSLSQIKDASNNAQAMISEYLQEESLLLAKARHVEQFNQAVDTLNADVARFEKRLNKLILNIENKTAKTLHDLPQPSDSNH